MLRMYEGMSKKSKRGILREVFAWTVKPADGPHVCRTAAREFKACLAGGEELEI